MTLPTVPRIPSVDELRALSQTYKDATEVLDQHRTRLHNAVADAADGGMSNAAISRAIGVSVPRVYGIIAQVYSKN